MFGRLSGAFHKNIDFFLQMSLEHFCQTNLIQVISQLEFFFKNLHGVTLLLLTVFAAKSEEEIFV